MPSSGTRVTPSALLLPDQGELAAARRLFERFAELFANGNWWRSIGCALPGRLSVVRE
jgi:hypothetical protein